MRPVEVKHLRRRDVDLVKKLVHVRRSKNETSHRVIPLNASAIVAAARMFERAELLGHTEPEHYLWPACQWGRYDATNPMLKWDTAWRALRDAAGLPGLRFHDLRHTVITELAEMGVADHVLESISGHLSRRMLEHYSHIRIDAKRQALDALDAARGSTAHNGEGNGNGANQTEIPAIVEVIGDDLTSQSRHSLVLRGSPPAGKLLIPLARRDVRVVEGARLESVCTGNRTVGSNPTLSATFALLEVTTVCEHCCSPADPLQSRSRYRQGDRYTGCGADGDERTSAVLAVPCEAALSRTRPGHDQRHPDRALQRGSGRTPQRGMAPDIRIPGPRCVDRLRPDQTSEG